jgi:hypothetical protein
MAFDNGDIRKAYFSLQLLPDFRELLPASAEQSRNCNAAHARRGPEKDLRCAVLADHLRLDMSGIDAEVLAQVHAKTLAV